MKVNDLINLIKKECGDKNPKIKFFSYEWDDDLTNMDYFERWFEHVSMENGELHFTISR